MDRISIIEKDVELLREKLVERKVERFSGQDIVRAFFGALVVGLSFIFAGAFLSTMERLGWNHIYLIVASTFFVLFLEIYFIGYTRIKGEHGRNIIEFTSKRLPVFYAVSIVVSFSLVYIFNLNAGMDLDSIMKMIFALSMPCSMGAAIGDLLKKY